jgi:hypothetical protein
MYEGKKKIYSLSPSGRHTYLNKQQQHNPSSHAPNTSACMPKDDAKGLFSWQAGLPIDILIIGWSSLREIVQMNVRPENQH